MSALSTKAPRQLKGTHPDKRFLVRASDKELRRPELRQPVGYVRKRDMVICHSMDRLARNMNDVRKVVLGFTGREVHVWFEKEKLTFTGDPGEID